MPTYLSKSIRPELDILTFDNKAREDLKAMEWEEASLAEITRLEGSLSTFTAGTEQRRAPAPEVQAIEAPDPLPIVRPQRTAAAPQTVGAARRDPRTQAPVSFETPAAEDETLALPEARPTAPQSASGAPAPMPSGQAPAQTQQPAGEIDNSSREAFVRTAYPYALQAADGDATLANQLLATAISENGRVGTGRSLGEMGFNVGGIQGVEGPAGSFTALDAGRPRQFAAYNNLSEGFRAVRDLVSSGRYAQAAETYRQTGDIDRYWREVNQAGYSETPDWQDRVAAIRRSQVEPVTLGRPVGPQPTTPPQAEQTPQAQRQAFAAGSYTPNQIEAATSEGLDYETALAVCGPAAAIAFARKTGRNPTMAEAVGLAREVGWTASQGMAGPGSQQRLLSRLGVAARLVDGSPDWQAVAADVQRGNPVILSTPGHYFVAERYDPESGQFDFGQSVAVLKASGGRRWFRPEELASLGMGEARASLFIDSPESPTPSVVAGRSQTAGPVPPAGAVSPAADPSPAPGDAGMGDMPRLSLGQPQPMPEDATAEHEMLYQTAVPNEQKPPPLRNIVPYNSTDSMLTGDLPSADGLAYRAPLMPTDPEVTPGAEYDPRDADQGAREWTGNPPLIASAPETATTPSSTEYSSQIPPGSIASPSPVDPTLAQDTASIASSTMPMGTASAPQWPSPSLPPQIDESGPREALPGSVGAGPVGPLYGPEPAPPEPAPEPESPLKPLYDMGGRVVGYVQDTLGQAPGLAQRAVERAAGPLQAAGNAVVESYNDPLWQTAPAPVRAIQLVREAFSKYGRAAATKLADEMGVSNEALFEIFGQPVSGQDIAGFAGETILDPTNYSPAPAAGAIRRAAGPVASAVLDPGGSVIEGIRGAGTRVRGALARNAENVAAADAPGVRYAGSGFVPEGAATGNIEARIAAARARLDAILPRFEQADVALARAADTGTDAELRAARQAYTPARREYDAATSELAALQDEQRGISARIDEAGYGQPVDQAGVGAVPTTAQPRERVAGEIPRTIDDTPRSGIISVGSGVVPEAPRRGRRTGATRNVVQAFEDQYDASGARSLVAAYEEATPARLTDAQRQVVNYAVDQVLPGRVTAQERRRVQTLLDGAVEAGERMLARSKVVATGLDGRAMDALIEGQGFTNKFTGIDNIEDAIDATWERVGKTRITRDQAREFVLRELGADEMILGRHNLNNRMYAHITAGPPQISEAVPSAWFIWEDETGRIANLHHHYAHRSPNAGIHAANTSEGDKVLLYSEGAIPGSRVVQAPDGSGPVRVGSGKTALPTGEPGMSFANTPFAVGPSGESRLRVLQMLASMPESGRNSVVRQIRDGRINDPETLAAVLLRESSAQQQPATSSAKALLGIPEGEAGGEAGRRIAEEFKLGMAVNRNRSEALIVDPNPKNVKAIYLVGNGSEYLNEVVDRSGGLMKGTKTRLQMAQEAQAALRDIYGKDVPIIFKDTSVVMRRGEPAIASGGKSINDAFEILPDRTFRPISAEQMLAPGRNAIREGYTRAGFSDIGSGLIPTGATARNAAQGALVGEMGALEEERRTGEEYDPRRHLTYALGGAGLATVAGSRAARGAARRLGSGVVPEGEYPRSLKDFLADPVEDVALPGMEPPRRVGGPPIPESPGNAQAVAEMRSGGMRQRMLPGTEPPAPRPIGELADELQVAPEQRIARASAALEQFPEARNWYERARMRNERRIQARGTEPVSPLRWLGDMVGNVGYSAMLGPSTFSVNLFTGIGEPLWSMPKETVRGVVRAIGTGNTAALREQGRMHAGALYGMTQLGESIVDVLKGTGRYASNPNFPTLSERTADPVARFVAQATEAPGRVWTGLPDAIFGTIALHSGQAREAAQIATDAGLKGAEWSRAVDGMLNDARAVLKGELPTSPDVQRVVDAGEKYASRQSYRDDLGSLGRTAEKVARLGNTPVLGIWASPFFKSIWNGGLRQAEKSPLGAVMNTQGSRTDKVYDALVGSAILLALGGYATRGGVTGSGPADPKERELLQEKGWQRYSTLTTGPDGKQYYVPNRGYAIFETPLNVAGEIHDALAYQKPDQTGRQQFDGAIRRVGEVIRQNPYALSGIMSILDAVQYGPASFAADNLTRLTPFAASARAIGTAGDPSERTVERGKDVDISDEIVQRWQQSVGLRSGLPEAQDAFGQPKPNEQPGGWAVVPRIRRRGESPVADIFREGKVTPGDPKSEIRVTSSQSVPPLPLNARERRAWDQKRGEVLLDAGQSIAADPSWKDAPPEVKEKVLRKVMDMAAKAADGQVLEMIGDDEITRRIDAAIARKAS